MTVSISKAASTSRAERALVLFEKGVAPTVIAERLGIGRSHIYEMLQRAKKAREKSGEVDA